MLSGHSANDRFHAIVICGEGPLPFSITGRLGHEVRIRKNEKQAFKPGFRVSPRAVRSGRQAAVPHSHCRQAPVPG